MSLLHPDFGLIFWTLVVFLITLFILRKYAWKPILQMLDQREKMIADSIAAAEKVKAEMSQMKLEHEQILAEAKAERSRILREAKQMKEQIIEQAREQAKEEARKIMEEAREAVERQKMAAITDIKNQLGLMAVELSERILRRALADPEKQEAYIKQLVEEVKLN
ncbi:MAG: F0F1 ATP synthase subunit B [Thermoflavifilum sp.]|jgi:F-type H+-transporting ATPase subunit b|uniref:F0F1 ATP synthase subunit B n=1 Tax=Thermoflavifilum sp. TaxID=1968839 RepID=UPI0018A44533|nr:F0F1 ATP synthase subunit B [Thermoflavifilum sp.]QOR75093.1 MAG: F0F1 ATP synthase subunit B [Thermoflavifilum sp.]